jgi:hypothetical protein
MSLSDELAADIDTVFLGPDFAESVEVRPVGEQPYTITAVCHQQRSGTDDQTHHSLRTVDLLLFCRRHASEGLDDPQRGLSVQTSDGLVWDFVEVAHRDEHALQVRFTRGDVRTAGRFRPAAL